MTKELSQDSKFNISIKTLIGIVVGIISLVSTYFGLMNHINSKFSELESKVEKALKLPEPGTGIYTIDMGDPAATQTWPPTRMEFNMKDQMARDKIDRVQEELKEIKDELKILRR